MRRPDSDGHDVTSEPAEAVDPPHADLLAFLDRLERANPAVAAAAVDREVDSLLGRTHQRKPPTNAALVAALFDETPKRAPSDTAFAWYPPIVAKLPPVLSQDETIEAAKAVEVGLFAESRLAAADPATMSRVEKRDLLTLVDRGRAEYEVLILSNLRLVFHWCKGIASSVGESWVQDAFQAGCIGLIRGLQGWDYAKGYTLSTYVSWHIRQRIQRWRWDETTIIRLPVHVWEKLEAGSDDLSDAVEAAALRSLNIVSLDEVDHDDPALAWDGGLDQAAEEADRERIVETMLSVLTEREADVLRLRNGLSDQYYGEPLTLDAIGAMYGVTRERIRQIESKAIEKIVLQSQFAGMRAVL